MLEVPPLHSPARLWIDPAQLPRAAELSAAFLGQTHARTRARTGELTHGNNTSARRMNRASSARPSCQAWCVSLIREGTSSAPGGVEDSLVVVLVARGLRGHHGPLGLQRRLPHVAQHRRKEGMARRGAKRVLADGRRRAHVAQQRRVRLAVDFTLKRKDAARLRRLHQQNAKRGHAFAQMRRLAEKLNRPHKAHCSCACVARTSKRETCQSYWTCIWPEHEQRASTKPAKKSLKEAEIVPGVDHIVSKREPRANQVRSERRERTGKGARLAGVCKCVGGDRLLRVLHEELERLREQHVRVQVEAAVVIHGQVAAARRRSQTIESDGARIRMLSEDE
eukprot:6196398-Pleurochrysis_carterae.AAC.4